MKKELGTGLGERGKIPYCHFFFLSVPDMPRSIILAGTAN